MTWFIMNHVSGRKQHVGRFYSRLFLSFLGRMGFLDAVPRVDTGKESPRCRSARFCKISMVARGESVKN